MTVMDVSVIIVNYYSEQLIGSCVRSIHEKTSGIHYEIILVNNGCGKESLEKLNSLKSDNVRIIDSEVNLGFGKANNLGASYAKGKYLFLLNPDTELLNNAVKILYDHMEAHPDTGVAGGNLYTQDGRANPSFCMNFDTLENEKRESSWGTIILSKIYGKTNRKSLEIHFNDSGSPMEVAYIFGADMFMKKELFDSLCGFDPDFFMYAEEEELTRRIHDRGYRIISVPDAKIMHMEGGTTTAKPGFSSRQFAMRMNGKMTYYDKCCPPNGAEKFYQYRLRKYQRLSAWQKLKGKNYKNSDAFRSMEILKQVWQEYCEERK